ncbi:MAG: M23 family metallopeptidase [Bacteroidales bacterium]|nr:M23 family metallopeptidase [Bacteroidales bacterium]
MSQYIYDKNEFRFKKARTSVWAVIRKILVFFVITIALAFLYYVLFALVFSTDTEQRLKDENRMYALEYPELEQKEELLSDVIRGLQMKDDRIYEEIFHASAPNMEPMSSVDFLMGLDSIPDKDIVSHAERKLDMVEAAADRVEENFRRVIAALKDSSFVMPPMHKPVKDFTFAQTGASVGMKINPFYKVSIMHNGLDIIAPAGEPVYAAADGVISQVTRSRKGLGNVVTVDHGNGYFTRYAHLSDMEAVKGRTVRRGTRLGYVGVSGNSFAPHLHFEVLRDTVVLDPVNHFFADVSPEEYVNMLVMSVTTGQSMD